MVASNDGGVIVMSANKLLKYDKNLNLVKEVELKKDSGSMCPVCQKMMEQNGMMMESMPHGPAAAPVNP